MWERVQDVNRPAPAGSVRQTWTFQGAEGYEDRQVDVTGPFFHGSRCSLLEPGEFLEPGHATNAWGDEGKFSRYIHFTDRLDIAEQYAEAADGSVYEVWPEGDFTMGYTDSEFKSTAPLRVVREVNA